MRLACGVDVGMAKSGMTPHSLRVGGAQALQDSGAAPWVIKVMGRWLSDCYRVYCNENFRGVQQWTSMMGLRRRGGRRMGRR